MITRNIEIKNSVGLHARPASLFVKEAKKFESTVRIKYDSKDVNGKSILEVLSLGAKVGSSIEVTADGADEKQTVEALADLVENFEE